MRCLVTGASGHLGACVVRGLVAGGHGVATLRRAQSDPWRLVDLEGSFEAVRDDEQQRLAAFAPDTVLHLAWAGTTAAERDDPAQLERNLIWSLRSLELARDLGCSTWLGVGSQAEIGPVGGRLREDMPERPDTLYGASKLMVGVLSRRLCERAGIRHVWVRPVATYGPADDGRRFIPSCIDSVLAGRPPVLVSAADRWDYLYVEDAAEAICGLASCSSASGVYVLGSGEGTSIRAIAELIRDTIDHTVEIEVVADTGAPRREVVADISRLAEATGWLPRTPLVDGLRRTIEWQRLRLPDTRRIVSPRHGA